VFVRKIKNKNGRTYVQIISKESGKYRVIHNVGNGVNATQVNSLVRQGESWISERLGMQEIDFTNERHVVEQVMESIERLELVGLELLLGRIFDEIGFNRIEDEFFKQLVICRIAFPGSKLKTTEYLYRYRHIDWSEDQLYRYLDKLYLNQKELVQQISYQHTLKILDDDISVVFYDVTTLYLK
jgi:hypothetical protein